MSTMKKVGIGAGASVLALVVALSTPMTKRLEGHSNTGYADIGGVPTACYGQTGKGIKVGNKYSNEQCEAWLEEELGEKWKGISDYVPQDVPIYSKAAFTVFAYNIGVNNFIHSTTVKYLEKNDLANACKSISTRPDGRANWSSVKGVYKAGLQNRRLEERAVCEGRLPKDVKLVYDQVQNVN